MPEDSSPDLGASLRQAREKAGITLRQIAGATKISIQSLEAIERNDVSRLPGGIFSRAFVRAYAREVGLDPEETVRRFVARFPDEWTTEAPAARGADAASIAVDDDSTSSRLRHGVFWLLPIVVVVAFFVFGGRLPWWRDQAAAPPTQAPEASSDSAPAPGGAVMTAPAVESSPTAAAPAPGGPASPGGAPVAEAAVKSPPATVTAAQQPASADGPPQGTFRLTLSPRESCWVQVLANGAPVFAGMMRAGDRQTWLVRGPVSLTLGNAGGMAIALNDRPARSLGTTGQVVTALLNADNLRTFIESR
jgi:cytoskeletal protein RodZ